jgi:hypothetical protein
MVCCICYRSAAATEPARPAGPSSCSWASSWRITASGKGLPQLVLVGVGRDALATGGAERVGHLGHQPASPAVFDDLADQVEEQVEVLGGVQASVGPSQVGDGVDDSGEVAGTEAARVDPAGGRQCVGGGPAGGQPLQVGPGGSGPVLDQPRFGRCQGHW